MPTPIIYGIDFSPFVRKIQVLLEEKGVAHEYRPTRPAQNMPPEIRAHSPLGKIPVLQHGDRWLADSSVICAYLDRVYPQKPAMPKDDYDAARVLWFEEYMDSGAMPKLGPAVFFERVLAPIFASRPCDEARVQKSLAEDLPPICDYLEKELGQKNYLVGDSLTLADIAVAGLFVNLEHAGVAVDAGRWPNLSRHYKQVTARPSFKKQIESEKKTLAGMKKG